MQKIGWTAVLGLVAQVIKILLAHADANRRQALIEKGIKIGHAQSVYTSLQNAFTVLEIADTARKNVRDELRDDPDSLLNDDGYKRPSDDSK